MTNYTHPDPKNRFDNVSTEAMAYLRIEFEVSWRHLGGLEDKRLRLFTGFCVFVGLLAIAASILANYPASTEAAHSALGLLLAVALVVISFACRQIALSERRATERYRNKINLMRRTFLECLNCAPLIAMQSEGAVNALQISSNPQKTLQIFDLLLPNKWNTALFMKVVYDIGIWAGIASAAFIFAK
jgi:hypothetical protein